MEPKVLMINNKGIMLSVKGNDYFISFNRIPWLKSASIMDALNVKMSGRNAIEWPTLDVDLEIDSLKHPERYPLIMNEERNGSAIKYKEYISEGRLLKCL